jgi:hypothetical protein
VGNTRVASGKQHFRVINRHYRDCSRSIAAMLRPIIRVAQTEPGLYTGCFYQLATKCVGGIRNDNNHIAGGETANNGAAKHDIDCRTVGFNEM